MLTVLSSYSQVQVTGYGDELSFSLTWILTSVWLPNLTLPLPSSQKSLPSSPVWPAEVCLLLYLDFLTLFSLGFRLGLLMIAA